MKAAGAVVMLSSVFAQAQQAALNGIKVAGKTGKAQSRNVIFDDSPLRQPRLYWDSGEFLDGEVVSADAQSLSFKSDLMEQPVALRLSALTRIDFPASAPTNNAALSAVVLRNGDCLFAEVMQVDASGITLKSDRHGQLTLPLTAVQSVRRLKSDRVLYAGPRGAEGWKHYGLRDAQGFPWAASDRGVMMTRMWNRAAMLDTELPDKFVTDIVLASHDRVRFALSFSQASNSLQVPAIETWDDELVIAQQMRFTPLRTLDEKTNVVALRVCVDRTANLIRVHDWSGALMGEFKTETVAAAKPCVMIRNKGAQLTLEHLAVRAWDGGELIKRDPALGFIEKLDGTIVAGVISPGADGHSVVAGGTSVPLDQVMAFDLGPQDVKAMTEKQLPLAQMLIEKPKPDATGSRVHYADGTLITGHLSGIAGGVVSMATALMPQPLTAKLQGMTRLSLQEPAPPNTPPEPDLDQLDTMHAGNIVLHGKLEGTGDKLLRWRLPGALNPVPLVKRQDLEIRRPARTDVVAAPALFFLKDGNVLGAKLESVSAEEVKLKSDVAETGSLKPGQLNAIHFNRRKAQTKGFGDAGWQIVKGAEGDVERKGDSSIVIKGSGSFGHGTIMSGDEVEFTMSAPSFWGALQVELFVGDLEAHPKGPQLHLIFSGADFWAVLETGENNSRSSEQLRNLTAKSIQVKLSFTEDSVQLSANGIPLMTSQIDSSQRKGAGLIFSPSAMWGNPSRDVEVTDFSVNARPDFVQTPSLSEEAKRQALTIPRFKRSSPATHVLLAPNGDVLRGKVEAASQEAIRFSSGAESMDIPLDRVAAAVWLDEPKKDLKPGEQPVKDPSKDDDVAKAIATHWLMLQDGSRLGVKVDRFLPDRIVAWSPSLGTVEVPNDKVASLKLAAPSPSSAMIAYRGWQPEFAPEPVLPETGGQSSPLLNKPAPDFALSLLGGGQFQLSAEKGKVIVLDFWATWCGPCVASMPEQLKAIATLDPAKVKFIAVNQGEPEPVIQKFLQTRGWQMTVALDSQQAIGAKYGVEGIPHCVVIDPEGKVIWTSTGYVPGESAKMAEMIRKVITVQ